MAYIHRMVPMERFLEAERGELEVSEGRLTSESATRLIRALDSGFAIARAAEDAAHSQEERTLGGWVPRDVAKRAWLLENYRRCLERAVDEELGDEELVVGHYPVHVQETSSDPRRRIEKALDTLSQRIRERPTVPPPPEDESFPPAVLLPSKHCAFLGCAWGVDGGEDALATHLEHAHADLLGEVVGLMPAWMSLRDRRLAAYNGAISVLERAGAPLADFSIDRRCLRNFAKATGDEAVEALICFS